MPPLQSHSATWVPLVWVLSGDVDAAPGLLAAQHAGGGRRWRDRLPSAATRAAAALACVVEVHRANGPTNELPCWPALLVSLARIELAVVVRKVSYCGGVRRGGQRPQVADEDALERRAVAGAVRLAAVVEHAVAVEPRDRGGGDRLRRGQQPGVAGGPGQLDQALQDDALVVGVVRGAEAAVGDVEPVHDQVAVDQAAAVEPVPLGVGPAEVGGVAGDPVVQAGRQRRGRARWRSTPCTSSAVLQ